MRGKFKIIININFIRVLVGYVEEGNIINVFLKNTV